MKEAGDRRHRHGLRRVRPSITRWAVACSGNTPSASWPGTPKPSVFSRADYRGSIFVPLEKLLIQSPIADEL